MTSLVGKVALITGASSGIGLATALKFSKLGAQVAIVGRNKETLDKVEKECKSIKKDSNPLVIVADLSKESEVKKCMEKSISHFGKLDILVNSAGILKAGGIETTSVEQFDELMNVNVRHIYQIIQLAIPHLKKTCGNIVNVSSVTGCRSFPGVMNYCISKSAIDQLTKCASLELASDNVRVNAVNPGVIVTNLHKRGGMEDEKYKTFLEHSKTTHPLGRAGTPDEVACAISFLADNNSSSFITGVVLPVDGGRHNTCAR